MAPGQQPARCERAGAQRVPCTGALPALSLPALAACVHRAAVGTGGRRGNDHSDTTGLLCQREKRLGCVAASVP